MSLKLGDFVEKVIVKILGSKKVDEIKKGGCGCEARKAKLNKLF